MQTRPLGRTGVEVSALCLGAMFFGTRNDEATSRQLLDRYVESGGSFVDTANIYAYWIPGGEGGESESVLNRWMKERGNRSQLFLASKCGFQYPGVERGLKPNQIEAECNKSLERMGVETIDLYYAHVDDRHTPLEETLAAFDRLVRSGKVRFIGASNYLAWRLEKARWVSELNNLSGFCCIQQRHTYLRVRAGGSTDPQVVVNDDLLDYCRNHDLTLLAYSPLLGGAYTRSDREIAEAYRSADTNARLAALNAVAQETGATPNQVVLAWMMQSRPSVLPLIAASTVEHLQENIDSSNVRLTEEQMTRLEAAGE